MKKIFFSAIALSILITQTGCFGSFELTKKVWEFNDGISESKFVKTLVFYVANIIPVYGIAGFVDVVVLNLIEFWSGSNPLAMEEGQIEEQLITYKGESYKMIATKNNIAVQKIEGNSLTDLGNIRFDDSENSWEFIKDDQAVTLINYHDDNNIEFTTKNGVEILNESTMECLTTLNYNDESSTLASK